MTADTTTRSRYGYGTTNDGRRRRIYRVEVQYGEHCRGCGRGLSQGELFTVGKRDGTAGNVPACRTCRPFEVETK